MDFFVYVFLAFFFAIFPGMRKEFALKTADETEAIQRAEELDSIYTAGISQPKRRGFGYLLSVQTD